MNKRIRSMFKLCVTSGLNEQTTHVFETLRSISSKGINSFQMQPPEVFYRKVVLKSFRSSWSLNTGTFL